MPPALAFEKHPLHEGELLYETVRTPSSTVGRFAIKLIPLSATPSRLILGNLNHPTLRLRHPLELLIEREDQWIVAAYPELDEFGYGAHLTEAVEDFRQSLIELYLTLKAEQDQLGPDLQKVWQRLHDLIEER